jgi:hypothetical protein
MSGASAIRPRPRYRSRASFRRPQRRSLRSGLKTRSTWRFRARMTPMRANIVGALSVTTSIKASIAACHSLGQRFGWPGGFSVAMIAKFAPQKTTTGTSLAIRESRLNGWCRHIEEPDVTALDGKERTIFPSKASFARGSRDGDHRCGQKVGSAMRTFRWSLDRASCAEIA